MDIDKKFEGAKAILNAYIESHKMRHTPERETVLKVVLNMTGHRTADEIQTLTPDNYKINRATVYSALDLFAEIGLVYCHPIIKGAALYENAYKVEPHSHYICTDCREIHDLHDTSITNVAMQAKTPRFTKERSSTYIYGVCTKCKAKKARWEKAKQKLALLSAAASQIGKSNPLTEKSNINI